MKWECVEFLFVSSIVLVKQEVKSAESGDEAGVLLDSEDKKT